MAMVFSQESETPTPVPSTPTAVPTETPVPTDTLVPTDSPTVAPVISGDTYPMVRDHPDLYQGDLVSWKCVIANFLGSDGSGNSVVGCWEYLGVYQGDTGEGAVILLVPPSINTNSMLSGDDVTVEGTVDQPYQGTNGFGATLTLPQLDVTSMQDTGHDPNATPS